MKLGDSYHVKPFDLHALVGISDRTLEMHLKLYEGYVKAANQLSAQIGEMLCDPIWPSIEGDAPKTYAPQERQCIRSCMPFVTT